MVSLLGFVKKATVFGVAAAVTTMSVYSALMSSYLYMVPSEMGVCALREYHLVPGNFDAVTTFHIRQFYTDPYYAPPPCKFMKSVPTKWINWMDTPARNALPFSTFCLFVGDCFLRWMSTVIGVMAAVAIIYQAIAFVYKVMCHLKYMTWCEIAPILPLLCYAWFETPFYIDAVIRLIAQFQSERVIGLLIMAWFMAWFLPFNGAFRGLLWYLLRKVSQGNILLPGFIVVCINCLGPRVTVFHMVISLLLAHYITILPAKIVRRRVLIMSMIHDLVNLAAVDRDGSTPADITRLFRFLEVGTLTKKDALKQFRLLFKKLTVKYHPDKNSDPSAPEKLRRILNIREGADGRWQQPEALQWLAAVGDFWLTSLVGGQA